jgi:cation diffusion facilitator CzcD-associated flavoprotein CzcO
MDASQTRPPVIIVGAGLTGLAAAYHLRSPYLLVEREAEVGGARPQQARRRLHLRCHGGIGCTCDRRARARWSRR